METNVTRDITTSLLFVFFSAAIWSGCAVGPNYKRPAVNVPPIYRGASPDAQSTSGQNTAGTAQQRRR